MGMGGCGPKFFWKRARTSPRAVRPWKPRSCPAPELSARRCQSEVRTSQGHRSLRKWDVAKRLESRFVIDSVVLTLLESVRVRVGVRVRVHIRVRVVIKPIQIGRAHV